jgi:hypothetical protein
MKRIKIILGLFVLSISFGACTVTPVEVSSYRTYPTYSYPVRTYPTYSYPTYSYRDRYYEDGTPVYPYRRRPHCHSNW